jgi:hypothetical protein
LHDFFVEPFSFSIAHVDPDIAGNRMGENNTQPFSWHWPGDVESILPLLVTSIVNATILSILNPAIAGLPDTSRKIREAWGCLEQPSRDGGPYAQNGSRIFNNNTAAGWVKEGMKLSNLLAFNMIYRGQQADGTDGAQMPKSGGCSYLPLNDIILPSAEHTIEAIGDELDDDHETQRRNPRSFRTTKTGLQTFAWKLQKRIIRQG